MSATRLLKFQPLLSQSRNFSLSSTLCAESTWLSKLMGSKITPSEASKESHSKMLSDKEIIYALHTHNVRPDSTTQYLDNYKKTVQIIESKNDVCCELVGSFSVQVGDMDQFIHIYRYTGGFEKIDIAERTFKEDPDYVKLSIERGGLLRNRHLQFLLAFSYWPLLEPRQGNNIYEMRSYRLRPGSMIEWGNNWARAINYRQKNQEAFGGFFSQIGRLHNVHHIWCYKNYQERKEVRENSWSVPGWDDCVAYTVPLIREMHCRILVPTEFSPTK